MHTKRILLLAMFTILLTACGPAADGSLYPVGTVLDDPQGDIAAPHADVTRFETELTERGVLIATFTLADLPAELPRNREGVPAGEIEYAWRVNVWVDGRIGHLERPDYRMQAQYISTGTAYREPGPLARLLEEGVVKHASAGDFFDVQNATLEFDTEANTLTLRSAVPEVTAQSAVLFEVIDGLAGSDSVELP